MFQHKEKQSNLHASVGLLELIYHTTVRDIRKGHSNAVVALGINILQGLILVGAFYVMFVVLGIRGAALRGDFLLYIMSGVFLFLTHNKAVTSVLNSEGPASEMMKHAPMTTFVAIASAALSTLYLQVLSLIVVLTVYQIGWNAVEIEFPMAALGMLILAWFTGCAIGIVLLSLKPWVPSFVQILSQIYTRANIVTSGKMFVANTLPPFMLKMFDWNPLFHTIDQARGFIFLNYTPYNSSVSYPVYVGITVLMLGMMGEFYTRKQASISWLARQ